MIYLSIIVVLLQSLFWYLLRTPIIGFEWIIEFKFLKLFFAVFLIWIISGKGK